MATLHTNIDATLIHGITGQEIEDAILEAGTAYTLEGMRETGRGWIATLLVAGYRYETRRVSALAADAVAAARAEFNRVVG